MQATSSSDDPITAINITPLVDVSLVLVIIFMITMPFLVEKGMKIKSSEQKVVAISSATEPILVEISAKGVTVEGKLVQPEGISEVIKKTMADRGVTAVAISADRKTLHGTVIKVLDAVIASGTEEVNLLDPEEGKSVSL